MIFETRGKLLLASLLFVGLAIIEAAPSVSKSEDSNELKEDLTQFLDSDGNVKFTSSRKLSDTDDMDNKLLSYEPMMNNVKYPEIEAYLNDLLKPSKGREIESSKPAPKKESAAPKMVIMDQKQEVAAAPSLPVMEGDSSARDETMKLIAHNSREVRLIGPDEKEVEMKDDTATKMAVALENLKKEAGEVWGQVNTKLDKGWTDFKTMVEDAVESAKKKSASSKSSPLDDISAAADSTVKTIKDQAEVAGTKIKGFFNNLGINV